MSASITFLAKGVMGAKFVLGCIVSCELHGWWREFTSLMFWNVVAGLQVSEDELANSH